MVQEQIEKQVQEAVNILKNGGVVVFPTETAYGLAADATNTTAVQKVITIKEREEGKSLPVIAASREMVERFAGIPRGLEKFASQYWPGPLTLVLPSLGGLASGVIKDGSVAIRVSSHPVARALCEGLSVPIVSTSANKSGQSACYTIETVRAQLGDESDFYIDAGVLESNPPSTIIGLDDYGYPEVVRHGMINVDL